MQEYAFRKRRRIKQSRRSSQIRKRAEKQRAAAAPASEKDARIYTAKKKLSQPTEPSRPVPPAPKKKKHTGLKITACILAVLIACGGITVYDKWYEILQRLEERDRPEVTITSLNSTDPAYAAARYKYVPLSYAKTGGSAYSPSEEILGLRFKAGVDFLAGEKETLQTAENDLKSLFEFASEMQAGLVFMELQTPSREALFKSSTADSVFDGKLAEYTVSLAAEHTIGLCFVYSPFIWSVGGKTAYLDPADPDGRAAAVSITKEIAALGAGYAMLTECRYFEGQCSYSDYAALNICCGFEKYKRSRLSDALFEISEALRSNYEDMRIGLSVEQVWRTAGSVSEGIAVDSDFEEYTDGYSDTKSLLSAGIFDFAEVYSYGALTDKKIPFETIVQWWSNAAFAAEIPLFITHTARYIGTEKEGWRSYDQLPKQILAAEKYPAYAGSIIESCSVLEEYPEIAGVITRSVQGKVDGDDILRNLTITKPSKRSTSTYESVATISGSSDPNFSVYINGKLIERTSKGYFSLNYDLKVGKNKFVIEHKGISKTYTIERKILVVQSCTPSEVLSVYAGTQIVFTALALKGSEVTAYADGQKIPLKEVEISSEDSDGTEFDTGDYIYFQGYYIVPEDSKTRTITDIHITGKWNGYSTTRSCADVKVKEVDKTTVRVATVVNDIGAETFRYEWVENKSVPTKFRLPKGTQDYIIGEVTYQASDGTVFVYYRLQSKMRVYKSENGKDYGDVRVEFGASVANNVISRISADVNSDFTVVSFDMSSRIPFDVELLPQEFSSPDDPTNPKYIIQGDTSTATMVKLTFYKTIETAAPPELKNSPVISSIGEWSTDSSGNKSIVLSLYSEGRFYGVYCGYNDNTLTFTFKNPPVISESGSSYGYDLSGLTVMLDPGHGGNSLGAVGANPNYPEKRINLDLALKTAQILEDLGATVVMTRNSDVYLTLDERVELCRQYKPDIFISMHHNWADAVNVHGTDSFYFMPFSKSIAGTIYNRVAAYYESSLYPGSSPSTYLRGVQYYPFAVTRHWYCPSTLVEYGFMSNSHELQKLIDPDIQWNFARATVRGIIDYVVRYGTVTYAGETAGQYDPGNTPETSSSVSSSFPYDYDENGYWCDGSYIFWTDDNALEPPEELGY